MKPEDLVGKDVRGLNSLQVSGFSRFDSGFSADSPATLDGVDLAQLFAAVPRKIDEKTPNGLVSTVTFSSIPGFGFRNLRLTGYVPGISVTGTIIARPNGDAGSGFDWEALQGLATTASAYNNGGGVNGWRLGAMSNAAVGPTSFEAVIFNYASVGFPRTYKCVEQRIDSLGAGAMYVTIYAGQWRDTTNKISSLDIVGPGNFALGTVFSLWVE